MLRYVPLFWLPLMKYRRNIRVTELLDETTHRRPNTRIYIAFIWQYESIHDRIFSGFRLRHTPHSECNY
jgi:hypothetical protein